MAHQTDSKNTSSLAAEAASWIAQLETGDMSKEDVQALREWVSRSPRHYEELLRMGRISQEANVLSGLINPINDVLQDQRAVLSNKRRGSAKIRGIGAFAAVAMAFIVVIGVSRIGNTVDERPFVITTEVGGLVERTLKDGTIVQLNTDSQIEVAYDQTARRVRLIKGEAFFDVVHDEKRPFIVSADDRFVRAVGTAFSVRLTEGDLSVVVSDGRVAISPLERLADVLLGPDEYDSDSVDQAQEEELPILLDAGQKLTLLNEKPPEPIASYTPAEIRRELSWKSGLLDFTSRPLEEVVYEVNRYTDINIEIADPDVRAIEFGGLFRTGETEQLFEALELSGLEVKRLSNTHVQIQKTSE